MNVTITGASGMIGRRVMKVLTAEGHKVHVLSRHAGTNLPGGVRLSAWDAAKGEAPEAALRDADAVVHLAGENVAQRWTAESKRRIAGSRIAGTRNLVGALAKLPARPRALVCASAIGYYGSRGDEILDETAAPGAGFLAEVCAAWEAEARAAEALGVRVVRMRIGVALDSRGGALRRMLTPFRLGAGGRIGGGRQWMSWIPLQDLAQLFRFVVENPVSGAVNAVAPYPVVNAVFTRELASALRRPALFPVPGFALRALFGEMSEVLLGSQRVIPKAADAAGFRFQFPQLGPALADILKTGGAEAAVISDQSTRPPGGGV
ncbi:MAG: TIGR01777 family oxidoreductase [Acidobacteriia bacterium]|nr:TIGR01777 family oxidoreductase [Terriglobia bacterium]